MHPLFQQVFDRHFTALNEQCASLPKPPAASPSSEKRFAFSTEQPPENPDDSRDWEEDV